MKKIFLLICFVFVMISNSSGQTKSTQYFDENNIEITKREFRKAKSSLAFLEIPGDSANQKKLVLRENRGQISNRNALKEILESETEITISDTQPIVIIFYPGLDECNKPFIDRTDFRLQWYQQLNLGVQKIAGVQPIYIYKNKKGLEPLEPKMNWFKDPNQTIENLFFKHPYPCQSFVVVSENGEFIAYFGEFSKEYVWEATKIMSE